MKLVSDLKGGGYITSTASVALLGAVSWKSAAEEPLMLACLIAGMALSVVGMMLRWRSHRLDQAEKSAAAPDAAPAAANDADQKVAVSAVAR